MQPRTRVLVVTLTGLRLLSACRSLIIAEWTHGPFSNTSFRPFATTSSFIASDTRTFQKLLFYSPLLEPIPSNGGPCAYICLSFTIYRVCTMRRIIKTTKPFSLSFKHRTFSPSVSVLEVVGLGHYHDSFLRKCAENESYFLPDALYSGHSVAYDCGHQIFFRCLLGHY